ncbi:twitching motility protein PilT [Leptospira noumeaensis]|uniref:Twitching motility protein PilT n=2 Tax=Leptospira noumeaensis TaxID=2484964 RepID=A0A4R9IA28_9LEPT|nr:twitching motility protein PilT [Leptospira noumeaensis]
MNLMYKFPDLAFCLGEYRLQDARDGLLVHLDRFYNEDKHSKILVFFDGKKDLTSDCYSEDLGKFSVHYSHEKKADELIIGYLNLCPVPSQCLVITTDKEIISFARRLRAKRMTSEEFYAEWVKRETEEDETEFNHLKEGLTPSSETDYWERQFLP